ncbi:hypothetical protein [Aurantiacibacter sp. D1-12]|nr:hypothetical protein [Aurantiacibacter sp. D1-12]MDE1466136.1 hypothetical protein [Aurantiacibacter sp. D1-12]
MTNNNEFVSKLFAAFGAVAMTMTLLVSSFAPPANTVSSMLV